MMKGYRLFLSSARLRNTTQRRKLFALIMKQSGHFCVDDIIAKSSPERASQATVYRMLASLKKAGFLEIHIFNEKTFYEVPSSNHEHHDHLLCQKCGAVEEFISPEIEEIQAEIAHEYGFQLLGHTHILQGVCSKCQ